MGPSMPSSDTWSPLGAPRAPHLGPWGPQEGSGCQKRACPHSTHNWGPKGPVFCWIFSAPRAPKAEPCGPHQWAIWVGWGPLEAPRGPWRPLGPLDLGGAWGPLRPSCSLPRHKKPWPKACSSVGGLCWAVAACSSAAAGQQQLQQQAQRRSDLGRAGGPPRSLSALKGIWLPPICPFCCFCVDKHTCP